MEMNDNTILRIKVPAHLYEAVKAQLTLNEAKGKHNLGAGMEVVKEKKASAPKADKPKASAAPKKEKMEVPKDGMKKVEKKGRSVEELKLAYEVLGEMIAEMEKDKKPKAPVEEQEEKGSFRTELKTAEELQNEDLTGYCYYVRSAGMSRTSGNTDVKTLYMVLEDNGDTCLVEDITEKDIAGNKKISKTPDSLTISKKEAIKQIASYPAQSMDKENRLYKNLVRPDLVSTSTNEEEKPADLKEYEVIYVVRNGKCYRKDDDGNMDEVSMSKCR